MLKRIYNKALQILDRLIGKVYLFLERYHIIQKIPYSVYKKLDNAISVNHGYPLNYKESDMPIFAHYTGYTTQVETIYDYKKVNVTDKGIIFKNMRNSWACFPHVVFRSQYGWLYLLKNYLFRKKSRVAADKIYVLVHDFWSMGNYYHWLIDSLPRILSIKKELAEEQFVLLLPAKCPDYILRTLSYFEIKHIRFIQKREYFFTEQLYLPYYLAGSGHIHPEKILEVKRYYLDRIKSESKKKERIYVSRSRQKARRIFNEEEVIALVKQYDFKVVFFEDYNFEEQVKLANSADILISSHGANMTNLMFMADHTKVLELIRSENPNFCYWALANVSKVDYYYQLCKVHHSDHLWVDINLFSENLEKLLND